MKVLKRIGIAIIALPFLIIFGFILFEIFGACVNHISTGRQTKTLCSDLEAAVTDIDIIEKESQTGNFGNGNHVDSFSKVVFTSDMNDSDIIDALDEKYDFKAIMGASLTTDVEGNHVFMLLSPAPFVDNIEGH